MITRTITLLFVLLIFTLAPLSFAESGDFISSFDGSDSGERFVAATGVAVDSNDNIFVTDITLQLVQIFDSDGNFITIFNDDNDGTPFMHPHGVAIDSNDRIIITDSGLQLVQIFDSDRQFITSIGGEKQFHTPHGVAVDSKDNIIVADVDLDSIQVFTSNGKFKFSFDGIADDGSTPFDTPTGVAVDSKDNIIVADVDTKLIQKFTSEGEFIFSFGGSLLFDIPYGVAVDSYDNIIVSDYGLHSVKVFTSEGVFLYFFDGTTGENGLPFESPLGVAVNSNDRIIVTDIYLRSVQIFEGFTDTTNETPEEILEEKEETNGSGCSGDCTPPTIGLDVDNKRIVENGFSYNNNPVDVIAWHTPYPLITAIVNQTNTVEIIAYDNGGIFNLDMIQFGLGYEEFGQPLHDVEVLIEVHLEALYSENKVIVEKVVIRDRDNLIDTFTVFAVTETVDCADDGLDNDCLKVTLEYSYREATINNMIGVNVVDRSRNTQNFYLNEGVEVIGESMNAAPTYELYNKKISQQTENLTLTLTRTDKVNHIWMDENGIEYLQISSDRFDRITPLESITCNDPPLSEINIPTRSNCNFRALMVMWNQ